MQTQWDVVIIGAGPAGMCAALEATTHGCSTLVLDRQSEAGGQIFRSAGDATHAKRTALGAEYNRGHDLVREFSQCTATFLGQAQVWHVTPGHVYFSHQDQSHCVQAKEVLIATGGMERPVPLPGWTLPGVMGAGAADVLLKSASLLPEGPVILCGNGPLILQTAVHLKHFNIPVAGVILTGHMGNVARAIPRVFGACMRPLYMLHGMGMGMRMVLGGRCYPQARSVAISPSSKGFTVDFRSMGKRRSLEGSHVLLHEGVISESRITRLARLKHAWNAEQRYWHVAADHWGTTSVPGIRCAGDVAGVRGADAAMALGRLAALDICRALGRFSEQKRDELCRPHSFTVRRCQAMQPFMDAVFAPVPENLLPADDAVVCRCEELTAGELSKAIREGNYSPDGLKAQARSGMGTCQGRMCSATVAEMIAHAHSIPLDNLEPYHAQPPLTPLAFGELANLVMPTETVS